MGAPKTQLTDEQRALIDEHVLDAIRLSLTPLRSGDIVERVGYLLEKRLPRHRDGFYRYVEMSLQRLKKDGRIRMKTRRWTTTSPTA